LPANESAVPDYSLYDAYYHDTKTAATRRAADAILPIVLSVVDVDSVLDVGCGYGDWLAAARSLGVTDLIGIEGVWAEAWRTRGVLATDFDLVLFDLEQPIPLARRYDLVICIEVAEHLTASREESFVADLCAAGNTVLLGAAIPGQKGPNHVNERWTSEWASEFAKHGYCALDCIRPRVWNDRSLWPNHRQNPLLFVAEDAYPEAQARAAALPTPAPPALDVVHPDIYLRNMPGDDVSLREHMRLLAQIPGAARRSLVYRARRPRRSP
jgi:SAM-dependent methyltransferase